MQQGSKYVGVTYGSEQNASLEIFDSALNMPLVLKRQGYKNCKFCVNYILEIYGILDMPQVLNTTRF